MFSQGGGLTEALRQYVLSVTAAAMLCAAVLCMAPEGGVRELVRLLCGIVLALCVLRPLSGGEIALELPRLDTEQGERLAAQGENEARKALEAGIKSRTEAYILDKAAGLGAAVEAEVTLDRGQPPKPWGVTLRGTASPWARGRLESILSSELGIPKERQQWIG